MVALIAIATGIAIVILTVITIAIAIVVMTAIQLTIVKLIGTTKAILKFQFLERGSIPRHSC